MRPTPMSLSGSVNNALKPLDGSTVWLNSEPLSAAALAGRVVLVDFWTLSCVNWLRTLPYVRAWAEKYRDRGLTVVGVHAPEFGFEHELDNVRRAMNALDVAYPVVIDNDFAIWRAFDNHYWPALYLADGTGRVRFHHFGEEAYAETERAIQQLLETGGDLVRLEAGGVAAPANWDALRSPETYIGYARGTGPSARAAAELALNHWTLTGAWTVEQEFAELEEAGGSIAYRFEARDLNLVLVPPAGGDAARFTVLLDGEPLGRDGGVDVDASGAGVIAEPRMYQLVRQHGAVRPRTFEMRFGRAGVRAYVFTFG
ncbi:MAG TPA: redoxin family protein [Thermoleophilaceae bacterium]|nr:redoxin family protein [Thermoleophilaceae bacterium]